MSSTTSVFIQIDRATEALRSNNPDLFRHTDGKRFISLGHGNGNLTDEQIDNFAIALRDNVHVQGLFLFLESNNPDLVSRIFETAIPSHRHLQTVFILCDRDINLTAAQARAVETALRTNTVMTELTVPPSIPAENLVAGLKKNKTLESFAIFDAVDLDGARVFASFLADERCRLTKFKCLPCNEGAQLIAGEGLSKNSTLIDLIISGSHQLTDEGCQFIENVLQHLNWTLESVYISDCTNVSDPQRQRIADLCQSNRRLKEEFQQFNDGALAASIESGVWPHALHHFQSKPDLIYAMLQSKPDVCREPTNARRRRAAEDE